MQIELTTGEQLRIWRRRAKLTLEAASELLGCVAATLSNIERGKQSPALQTAVRIEEHAGIPCKAWTDKPEALPPQPNPQETTT